MCVFIPNVNAFGEESTNIGKQNMKNETVWRPSRLTPNDLRKVKGIFYFLGIIYAYENEALQIRGMNA